jgi:hypothetical protein
MHGLPTPTPATGDDEASILPTKNVRDGPNLRTLPWDLPADKLELVSPPVPQAVDIQAKKKPRLEEGALSLINRRSYKKDSFI